MKRPVPDQVILGLLTAQPAHGYELLAYFHAKNQLGRIWTMSTSQLYAVLKRLAQGGAIIGREVDVADAPPRVEYQVTQIGRQQLEEWLYDPKPSASIHRIRVLFLSRVFIANLLGLSVDNIVENQAKMLRNQRDIFFNLNQTHQSDIEELAVSFVINQLEAAITWLENNNFSISVQSNLPVSERKIP